MLDAFFETFGEDTDPPVGDRDGDKYLDEKTVKADPPNGVGLKHVQCRKLLATATPTEPREPY